MCSTISTYLHLLFCVNNNKHRQFSECWEHWMVGVHKRTLQQVDTTHAAQCTRWYTPKAVCRKTSKFTHPRRVCIVTSEEKYPYYYILCIIIIIKLSTGSLLVGTGWHVTSKPRVLVLFTQNSFSGICMIMVLIYLLLISFAFILNTWVVAAEEQKKEKSQSDLATCTFVIDTFLL